MYQLDLLFQYVVYNNLNVKRTNVFNKGEEDCLDDFVDKTNKIFGDFLYFVRQKQITWTDGEKKLYSNETVCYLCDKEFEENW